MKVIFCRNNLPGSLLIRLFTWSKWSHCGVVLGDEVIHATALRGVHSEPLEDVKARYKWEIREMSGHGEDIRDLVGYKYDWGGVFGHWVGYWNDPEEWFCSEAVAYCSSEFNDDLENRITPHHCYMISHALPEDNKRD